MVLAAIFSTQAQKRVIQLNPALEVGLPVGSFRESIKSGFGLSFKGLYGVIDNGNITLTVGSGSYGRDRANSVLSLILAGYRHRFNRFYIESEFGYGNNTMSKALAGGNSHISTNGFVWTAGMGYVFSNVQLGARYQSLVKGDESFNSNSLDMFVFQLGYMFRLRKS